MTRTITVGLDGSAESRAAAEWAAREAVLRELPLRLLHVRRPDPGPAGEPSPHGAGSRVDWSEQMLRKTAEGLRQRHPGVEVTHERIDGMPYEALIKAAEDAELLVLGSRGLGGLGGFLVGSVGFVVVAHAEQPVVLVRAGAQAADEHEPDPAGVPSAATHYRPVLLGLDADRPHASVIEFAFAEAARRDTTLRVVHGWALPPYYVYGLAAAPEAYHGVAQEEAGKLTQVLAPWREKFPQVEVVEESFGGSPSIRLVEASAESSLVVVGRRARRNPLGAHIGSIAHAVMHHGTAPVAVVAHD
ncbi:universal stress protein [Streptomyces marokkonensis]|uniref:Universal stress protein n=1 Tax=Streptomyces marokkonensis TaxID=324855 RepID=A0ABW6Q2D5_9ACTN